MIFCTLMYHCALPTSLSLIKVLLGGSKDGIFSCFLSSCQSGLNIDYFKWPVQCSSQSCTLFWMPNLKFKYWTDSNLLVAWIRTLDITFDIRKLCGITEVFFVWAHTIELKNYGKLSYFTSIAFFKFYFVLNLPFVFKNAKVCYGCRGTNCCFGNYIILHVLLCRVFLRIR